MGDKLKSDEAKNYKIVSRILGIIVRIGNVGCWIGVVGVAFAAIAAAIIAPNVKIDSVKKEITLFNQTPSYTIKDKDLEIVGDENDKVIIKDNTVSIINDDAEVLSIKLSNESLTQFEEFVEDDAMKTLAVLPYTLAFAAVALSLIALALGHVAKVLKNVAVKKTPFEKDNATRLEKAAKYLLISFCIMLACNLVMSIVSGGKAININGGSISVILGLYVLVYVFKYGASVEDKKEEKKD